MAALNYAKDYSQALAQQFPYVLYFGALYATPNNGRYRWTGAKTIEIPVITTTGRTDANRDTIGAKARRYDNTWETKVLENERKWDTLVQPMDIDQTDFVTSISNITQVYNQEQKFPEMDAYTISKIHSLWTASGGTVDNTVLSIDNFLTQFDKAMQEMTEKRVPAIGRILYVIPAVNTIIKNVKALSRQYNVEGATASTINRLIGMLDTVKIEEVPSEMMKTVYDFTTGWAVAGGAKQINFVLIHPLAVITPITYNFAMLDAPSAKTDGKYLYYEESFEDVFILNNKKDAIAMNVSA